MTFLTAMSRARRAKQPTTEEKEYLHHLNAALRWQAGLLGFFSAYSIWLSLRLSGMLHLLDQRPQQSREFHRQHELGGRARP